jgi:hypothetical protein
MNIRDNISPNNFYQEFTEPEGYGAFSDEQLNERVEEVKEEDLCEECGKHIDDCKCYSPCCGAPIILHDICSECKEHCIEPNF